MAIKRNVGICISEHSLLYYDSTDSDPPQSLSVSSEPGLLVAAQNFKFEISQSEISKLHIEGVMELVLPTGISGLKPH